MEHMQMYKAWVIVNSVIQASNVQVLEWKHQKNVQMEHTATQLVLDTVFCVQKVKGEVIIWISSGYQVISFINTNCGPFIKTGCRYVLFTCNSFHSFTHHGWLLPHRLLISPGYAMVLPHGVSFISTYSYVLAGYYTNRLPISPCYAMVNPYGVSVIHSFWLVITQTDYRYHLVMQWSIHMVFHSFIHFGWLLHRQTTMLCNGPSTWRIIHSYFLAGYYTDRLLISPGYAMVLPHGVSFIHIYILAGHYTDWPVISSAYSTVYSFVVSFVYIHWLVVRHTSCTFCLITLHSPKGMCIHTALLISISKSLDLQFSWKFHLFDCICCGLNFSLA